jgi:hypothetical protein
MTIPISEFSEQQGYSFWAKRFMEGQPDDSESLPPI